MKSSNGFFRFGSHGPILMLVITFIMLLACQKESRGFVLPQGDIAAGKLFFTSLYCNDCHSIGDIAWTGPGDYKNPEIKLGGEVTTLKTYGELVSSVINPSHKISQKTLTDEQLVTPAGGSKMEARCYNDVMTVQQLVDIVAFLQSNYKLVQPTNTFPYK